MSSRKLSIVKLCSTAKISRATYYDYNNGIRIDERDEFMALLIEDLHFLKKEKYGHRKMQMAVERLGLPVSLNKVKRIKKQYGFVTKVRRKNRFRVVAKQGEEHAVAENLVKRRFNLKIPDRVYSTDISRIDYGPGKVAYLSALKDLATKEVLLHTVSPQVTMGIAREGLKDLLLKLPLRKREKLIIHSDQGSHYTHPDFRDLLKEVRVKQSMSRKGNCLDNAPIESFFGHLKDEMDLAACRNLEELVKETAKYIDYYNNQRPQWDLKKRTPAECRGST